MSIDVEQSEAAQRAAECVVCAVDAESIEDVLNEFANAIILKTPARVPGSFPCSPFLSLSSLSFSLSLFLSPSLFL